MGIYVYVHMYICNFQKKHHQNEVKQTFLIECIDMTEKSYSIGLALISLKAVNRFSWHSQQYCYDSDVHRGKQAQTSIVVGEMLLCLQLNISCALFVARYSPFKLITVTK